MLVGQVYVVDVLYEPRCMLWTYWDPKCMLWTCLEARLVFVVDALLKLPRTQCGARAGTVADLLSSSTTRHLSSSPIYFAVELTH